MLFVAILSFFIFIDIFNIYFAILLTFTVLIFVLLWININYIKLIKTNDSKKILVYFLFNSIIIDPSQITFSEKYLIIDRTRIRKNYVKNMEEVQKLIENHFNYD